MTSRIVLFTAVSAATLLATTALAQTKAITAAAASPAAVDIDELVVTGSRAEPRSRLESLAPVDVVTAKSLQKQGTTELAAALAATVPSIDFPRPSNTDGTDSVRPVTLRGQGPDQTLVLINGVRAHTSALVNLNGSVGRGSAAVDLNTIPEVAIDRIEVLRDGASALYGSDAIAGVINIGLRQADSGGGASVTYGEHVTHVNFFNSGSKDITDGGATTVQGWQGFKLGSDGFLTVSAAYRDQDHTNRSDTDPRFTPSLVRSRFGDGDVEEKTIYFNAGKPLGGGWEAFAWGGGQQRHSETAATYRAPNDASQNIASVYPDGYLPLINTHSDDFSVGGALKGEIAGWKSAFSIDYGWNRLRYGVEHTLNPSLGPTSPQSFYAGQMTYDQTVGNADFSHDFDVGLAGPLNVAFGLEARNEQFKIGAGDPGSYARGTVAPTLSFGSRGFTGFTPENVIDKSRTNVGAYLALEAKLTDRFTGSAAVRQEHYSDFGDNTSGKVSGRFEVTPAAGLPRLGGERLPRAGPAAAVLHLDLDPVHQRRAVRHRHLPVGQLGRQGARRRAAGAREVAELRPGRGLPLRQPRGDDRRLRDRRRQPHRALRDPDGQRHGRGGHQCGGDLQPAAALRRLGGPLLPERRRHPHQGRGLRDPLSPADRRPGELRPDGGGQHQQPARHQDAGDQAVHPAHADVAVRPPGGAAFTDGTPKWKVTLQSDWEKNNWGATLRSTFYGDVLSPGTLADGSADIHTGKRSVWDLEGRYTFPHQVTVAVGADNLFDQYPKQIGQALDTTGAAPFTSFSPFGFNGRFVYGRVSVNW